MRNVGHYFLVAWMVCGLLTCTTMRFYPLDAPIKPTTYVVAFMVWPMVASMLVADMVGAYE